MKITNWNKNRKIIKLDRNNKILWKPSYISVNVSRSGGGGTGITFIRPYPPFSKYGCGFVCNAYHDEDTCHCGKLIEKWYLYNYFVTIFWQLQFSFSYLHDVFILSLPFFSPLFLTNKKWEKQGCHQCCY